MIRLRRKYLFTILIMTALFLIAGRARATEGDITKKVLPNGLTVIVKEVHSAPVASLQMWVKVGSAYETPDEAGISHVFEHMLFKGTEKRKMGEIAKAIESVGGDINAYTSFDDTVYHIVVPARFFSTGLDVLSDAVQHSSFDPEELKKELDVILEEIRMNEDSPMRTMYKKIFGTAYTTHPYKKPVIGYEKAVKGLTRKEIISFFKKWYVPNNMTLVIVGDVDAARTFRAVEGSFKGFKRGEVPHVERPDEPRQKVIRTSVSSQDIKDTYLGIAFHIPGLKDHDTYGLDVAASILADGVSSRLYKALKIEERLVHGISAYAMSLKDPGLFFITASLDSKDFKKATEAILFEVKRLATEGPDPEEMERARTNLESSFIYSKETMQGTARSLGYYQTIAGDYGYERRYIDGIRGVTSGDIKEVIKKYLNDRNMTVSIIMPDTDKGTIDSASIKETALRAEERAEKFKESISAARSIKKVRLENGITLIVKEVHTNPTVAFYATFPGGLRFERPEVNGIGNFTAGMLTRGTATRTREELAKEIEGMAGSVGGFSGRNSTGVSADFLATEFDRGLKIIADIIKNPSFPDVEIERLRKDILAAIKSREDNIPSYTFKLLLKRLYGAHPYGMPVIGSAETVKRIDREAIASHYRRFFVPARMVLTIAGDVRTGYVIKKVKETFLDFKRAGERLTPAPAVKRPAGIEETGEIKDKAQTNIALGFIGTTIGSDDSYPLAVLSEVLSGQGGRLFINLRDKRSLAYSVTALLREGVDPGFFALYIASAPEKKNEAIKGLLSELKEIRSHKVSDLELQRAKNYIIGGYEIGLQEASSQAADMANNELYGLGYNFNRKFPEKINGVTAEDILRVARKYIDLDAYTISIVGPEGREDNKD